jgi:hypothetical protein
MPGWSRDRGVGLRNSARRAHVGCQGFQALGRLCPVTPPPGGRTRTLFKNLVHINLDPALSKQIEEVGLEVLSLMPLNLA